MPGQNSQHSNRVPHDRGNNKNVLVNNVEDHPTTRPTITTTEAVPQSIDADRASHHSGGGEGAVMLQQRVANEFRKIKMRTRKGEVTVSRFPSIGGVLSLIHI